MSEHPTPEPGRPAPGHEGTGAGEPQPPQAQQAPPAAPAHAPQEPQPHEGARPAPRSRREARAGAAAPGPTGQGPAAAGERETGDPVPAPAAGAAPATPAAPSVPAPSAPAGRTSGWVPPAARQAAGPLGEPSFSRVSSRLIALTLLSNAIATVITVAALVAAHLLLPFDWTSYLLWAAAIPVVIFIVQAIITARQVRAMGYSERPEDLLIATGIMFRRLVVVPYGRLQFVEVKSGPLERGMGLSTLHLHTAAAATKALLPGLPHDEAVRLRERLASRAEDDLAGL